LRAGSATARKLCKAQSSISGLISNLEIEAGLELFDRSKNRPNLTRQGAALLHYATAVVEAHRSMVARVTRLNTNVEDEVRLMLDDGVVPHPCLHQLTQPFAEHFPQTRLHIFRASRTQALDFLRQGKVELAVVSNADDYGKELQYGVVVAPDHALVKNAAQTLEDLCAFTELQLTDPFAKVSGSNENRKILCTNHYDTLMEWLQLGLGWAELPLNSVQAELQRKCLHHLAIQKNHVPRLVNVDLVWNRDIDSGNALGWLIEQLPRMGKKLFKL
jgi:DNA-binding transcriptional LysR family regulator